MRRPKQIGSDIFVKFLAKRGFLLTRPRFHEENEIDLRAVLSMFLSSPDRPITVLQIGAGDGREIDPIYEAVVSRGWQLTAVEPVPATFARLQATYSGMSAVTCVNAAVGHTDGTVSMYTLHQETPVDGLDYSNFSSMSREVISRHWRYIPDIESRIEEIKVRSLTLATLIEECNLGEIDILQVDTEGFDYEIVKMALKLKPAPPIIAFEWVNLSREDMWACRTDLIANGYRWLLSKGDVIATRLPVAASTVEREPNGS